MEPRLLVRGVRSAASYVIKTPSKQVPRVVYNYNPSAYTSLCPASIRDRSYHVRSSPAIEAAHARVLEDFRKAREETALDIFCSLQTHYPDWTVTMTPGSTGLKAFADAGQATAKLDVESEKLLSQLKYELAKDRKVASFQELVEFARYDYQWAGNSFIVYQFCKNYYDDDDPPQCTMFFILQKREGSELDDDGRSKSVKGLIAAATSYAQGMQEKGILLFDQSGWKKNTELWESVQQSSWENVILDESLKASLKRDVAGFFDERANYERFGVTWKRGIIMHGLPGNGKTLSVKALMRGLATRPNPVPTLYVKSTASQYGVTYAIRDIFKKARKMSPCLLVFEDLDSLITEDSRSYFLNEVDGLESNDGIMMIGSTNYLEKLDAGITKRPSRFDRKYHFDLPAAPERTKYCEQWRSRLADKAVNFPQKMCSAIAGITDGFSFAYLQEAFISSLLVLANEQNEAGRAAEERAQDGNSSDFESVPFWRVINQQVNMLRNEIKGSRKSAEDAIGYNGPKPASKAGFA
ncbi:hypothetical protein N7G274_007584 [Stereocaulon virgatum]|uniref:AAA+ ATPase domain-containing protein n=1 Tax=Stereocaulon virgatum TaxID=373712 RepID=A0ABR4A1H7_9LECA